MAESEQDNLSPRSVSLFHAIDTFTDSKIELAFAHLKDCDCREEEKAMFEAKDQLLRELKKLNG